MAKQAHQSVIEFNGQRYNAQTGSLIDVVSMPIQANKPTMNDVAPQPKRSHTAPASMQIHKTTQPGKTLMRHGVKKPSTITDHKTIAMDVVQHGHGPVVLDKFHTISPERVKRADSIRQNTLVNRFGGELRESATKTQPLNPSLQKSTLKSQASTSSPIATSQSQSATNKMLDQGLRNATSHEESVTKKSKLHHRVGKKLGLSNKVTSIASGGIALAAIAGFFVYQNIPAFTIKYASTKAGIHASLPTYQPAGFTVNNHVAYSPGQISVAYKANADKRAYVVTQKSTNWNSDALKEHIMSKTGSIPQSYPDNGQTIYLHDNNQADWVNNGVWYSISGHSDLNTDQLIKIATSL